MATQKEIQLCQEILGVAIQLNSTRKYNVFVDFSGHVKWIEVRIQRAPYFENCPEIDGWSTHDRVVYLSTEYKPDADEDMGAVIAYKVDKLQEIKDDLIKLLSEASE